VRADLGAEHRQPFAADVATLDAIAFDAAFRALEARARDEIGGGHVDVHRAASMRVVGQAHALEVPLPDGPIDELVAALPRRFSERYVAAYGVDPAPRLQVTALRVRVVRPAGAPTGPGDLVERHDRRPAPMASRPAYFSEEGGFVPTPVFDWTRLGPGDRIEGAAVVQALDSTVVVPPGWVAVLDHGRNLVLHR
jgi:N-methylhydantoinase A